MSVTPIVIVDNRQVPHAAFEIQSALLSYNNNMKGLIGKYLSLSQNHHWIKPIQVLLSAQSADKAKLTLLPNLSQLQTVLDLQHSCEGDPELVSLRTWSKFLLDGFMKCLNFIHQRRSVTDMYSITIYGTDATLFGSSEATPISDGLKKIFQCIRDIRWLNRVEVRIVCTVISDTSDSEQHQNTNLRNLQQMILVNKTSIGGDEVKFHQMLNSSMHYDEELRFLIGKSVIPVPMTLTFPTVCNAQCKCAMLLLGATMSAMDALHSGLTHPEVWSLVPRGEVDPLYLDGKGLLVKCDSTGVDTCTKQQIDRSQNAMIYRCLMNMLAKRDVLLVLKIHNNRQETDEFWALVPPAVASDGEDDDEHQQDKQQHMVLLKLADRDSVVMDLFDFIAAEVVQVDNSPSGDPIEDEQESTLTTLRHATATAVQGKSTEEEQLVLAETEEYLEQSLFESGAMSAPARFNPLMCDSGVILYQYQDAMRKTHKGLVAGGRGGGPSATIVSPRGHSDGIVESEEVNGILIQTKRGRADQARGSTTSTLPSTTKSAKQSKPKKQKKNLSGDEQGEVDDEDGFVTLPFINAGGRSDSKRGGNSTRGCTTSSSRGKASSGGRGTAKGATELKASWSESSAPSSPHFTGRETFPVRPPMPTTGTSFAAAPLTVQQALTDVIRNAHSVPSDAEETQTSMNDVEVTEMYDQAALSSLASLKTLTPHQQQLARILINKQTASPSSAAAASGAAPKFLKRKFAAIEPTKDMFQNSFY